MDVSTRSLRTASSTSCNSAASFVGLRANQTSINSIAALGRPASLAMARGKAKRFTLGRRRAFGPRRQLARSARSEEHTSELQSLMRISYAVFCLKKKNREKEKYNDSTQGGTQKSQDQKKRTEDSTEIQNHKSNGRL